MKDYLLNSPDIRQSKAWGKYLEKINWVVYSVGGVNIFVRRIPLIGSFIKIQHPSTPVPFAEIDKIAKKERTLAVILEPHNFGFNEAQFHKMGYQKSKIIFAHTATIRIDLKQTPEKLLRSFSENARRNIKKARSNKLATRLIPLEKLSKKEFDKTFQIFFGLLKELSKEKRFYIPKEKEWYDKTSVFKGCSVILFAYQKDKPIAAIWFGTFKKTIYYLHTGITEDGYEKLANYLLVWQGMLWGKKKGLSVFDFEAIFDPRYPKEHPSWRSFSEFKKRFHGELIQFPPPQIKFYSRIFKAFYLCSKIFSR